MKQFFLSAICMVVLASTTIAQSAAPSAEAVMQKAMAEATAGNKNILLMFHASWCGWCHRMDSSLYDPACKKYFTENYVITHLVVDESEGKKHLENPGANELRKKYHGDGIGIPFWLIFDKQGKLLADSKMRTSAQGPGEGDNIGCPANEKEVAHFIAILRKTSSLNDEALEIIRQRFRENER